MFFDEGNTVNMFIRPLGYTQMHLASDTKCKHNLCLFSKKLLTPHRAPLSF